MPAEIKRRPYQRLGDVLVARIVDLNKLALSVADTTADGCAS